MRNEEVAPSSLNPSVQTLVKFFFDQKMMESSIVSVNVDIKKMPLGQLSRETVLAGYKILRDLEDAIQKGQTHLLADLSGRFYTTIPHNFGMQKMSLFIIQNTEHKRKVRFNHQTARYLNRSEHTQERRAISPIFISIDEVKDESRSGEPS